MAKGSQKVQYKTVNYDGEKYKIAIMSKGRKLPKSEKLNIAKLVCKMYGTDKHSLDECLAFCGIKSHVTWLNWMNDIDDIDPLYLAAQAQKDSIYRHRLKNRARTMAERLIDGYVIQVQEDEQEPNEKGEMKVVKTKTKNILVRPSVRLIEATLYNMDGKTFVKNPEPHKGGNEENAPTDIKIEIVGGKVPAVTNEEDINQNV